MKVEIKLENPKLCNGCPGLWIEREGFIRCQFLIWDTPRIETETVVATYATPSFISRINLLRPRECIEKCGE